MVTLRENGELCICFPSRSEFLGAGEADATTTLRAPVGRNPVSVASTRTQTTG